MLSPTPNLSRVLTSRIEEEPSLARTTMGACWAEAGEAARTAMSMMER
jgi:hypothetical protein